MQRSAQALRALHADATRMFTRHERFERQQPDPPITDAFRAQVMDHARDVQALVGQVPIADLATSLELVTEIAAAIGEHDLRDQLLALRGETARLAQAYLDTGRFAEIVALRPVEAVPMAARLIAAAATGDVARAATLLADPALELPPRVATCVRVNAAAIVAGQLPTTPACAGLADALAITPDPVDVTDGELASGLRLPIAWARVVAPIAGATDVPGAFYRAFLHGDVDGAHALAEGYPAPAEGPPFAAGSCLGAADAGATDDPLAVARGAWRRALHRSLIDLAAPVPWEPAMTGRPLACADVCTFDDFWFDCATGALASGEGLDLRVTRSHLLALLRLKLRPLDPAYVSWVAASVAEPVYRADGSLFAGWWNARMAWLIEQSAGNGAAAARWEATARRFAAAVEVPARAALLLRLERLL